MSVSGLTGEFFDDAFRVRERLDSVFEAVEFGLELLFVVLELLVALFEHVVESSVLKEP